MEQIGFYTNILTSNDRNIPGLDDLTFSMTQDTQQTNDLPSEVQHDVVQVQPPEVAKRRRSAKGLAKRTKNFDQKEDVVVCSAWLNVSKDPIHGANQTRSSFWKRILDYFEEHKETPYVMTESSIMHRWLIIQKEVNKYCSCYEAIERRNQSGATIQDMITQASEMYTGVDEENKSFTLLHCWNRLKDEDKWKAKRIELAELEKQGKKKKQKVSKDSTPKNVEDNNTEDAVQEIAAPRSEGRKRPPGQKAAKEALRRGDANACMEALDKMWAKKEASDMEREKKKDEREKKKEERFQVSLELEKKRVKIEENKAEADLIKEEKEIMQVDMSTLTPLQKQYYEMMQKKIIERRLAN